MAECAGLPVLQTVAEIEAQLDERYAPIWREALGKLTAAGVAATMVMGVGLSPDRANAVTTSMRETKSFVYYVNWLLKLVRFSWLRPGRGLATIRP